MAVSCPVQGCKALLRIVKRRYIKYLAFAFAFFLLFGLLNIYYRRRLGSTAAPICIPQSAQYL